MVKLFGLFAFKVENGGNLAGFRVSKINVNNKVCFYAWSERMKNFKCYLKLFVIYHGV